MQSGERTCSKHCSFTLASMNCIRHLQRPGTLIIAKPLRQSLSLTVLRPTYQPTLSISTEANASSSMTDSEALRRCHKVKQRKNVWSELIPVQYLGIRLKCISSIVAITGLGGKAFASWQIPDGSMWLRDALPHDLSGVQTHIYGYRSALARSLSSARLRDFTDDFAHGLRDYLRSNAFVSTPCSLFMIYCGV